MTPRRWQRRAIGEVGDYVESSPKIETFLAEIDDVCQKHGISIAHEDGHGSFILARYQTTLAQWLNEASDYTEWEDYTP